MTSMTSMSREELRALIRETVEETVKETLVKLGVSVDDPIEVQKDFQHLREWRLTMASVKMKAIVTALGIMVTGSIAAMWVGITSPFKH